MLADPARCQVLLVTLPETTPINEAVETDAALHERIGVHVGAVVVNGVDVGQTLPADVAKEGSAMRAAADFRNARRALQAHEQARLAKELPLPQLVLSLVPGSVLDAGAVDRLAAELDAS